MLRTLFLILNLTGLFIGQVWADEVKINVKVPETVVAGQNFQVELTLDKGQLESFSRIMQDIPAGLTAESVNNSNSDFSFRDQKVRFIWLKMPATNQVTVAYTLSVDKRLKGSFDLGGKFSYVDNNERKSLDIPSHTILITPSPDIDTAQIVDIKNFKNTETPETPQASGSMFLCIRQKPELDKSRNFFIVNILISKDAKQKLAKIEEIIPSGYTAENIDCHGGTFSSDGNKANIFWATLPADPYFVISYKLIPKTGKPSSNVHITGTFSYLNDDKKIVRDISEQNMKLKDISSDQLGSLVAGLPANGKTTETPETATSVTSAINDATISTPATTPKKKGRRIMDEAKEALASLRSVETANQTAQLEPQNGVYFRIQIEASKTDLDLSNFSKFTTEKIMIEQHDGWKKYSIGTFREYKEARDYRIHIWNTTPLTDAFVTAYHNGKRISVQEALTISNQKWYK